MTLPFKKWVVFDQEWDIKTGKIFAASFIDQDGKKKVLHIKDMDHAFGNPQRQLISTIQATILKYECSIGWGTKAIGSDLDTLYDNALAVGLEPIYNKIYKNIEGKAHIDLCKVFGKKLLQLSVFENRYRDLKLDTVAKCFLGRGKIGHGADAVNYTVEQQKAYVLDDAQLVFELLNVGMWDDETDKPKMNGEVMALMGAIAELVKIPYDRACNTGLSVWWEKIFKDENAPFSDDRFKVQEGQPAYQGGEVMEPTVGAFKNISIVDVQSLYPTMIINHNLSHETVCCRCCADDPSAKVNPEVLDKGYWICKKKVGVLARKIAEFKVRRVAEKKAGNEVLSGGLKILLNGAYGCYGFWGFKYSDRRVAELTTAFSRWTNFKNIKPIAEKIGFIPIGGDTDSLFLQYDESIHAPDPEEDKKFAIETVISQVKENLNVVLEYDKDFESLVITGKKHYWGVQRKKGKRKIVVKGMEWKKGDRSAWVNGIGEKLEHAFLASGDGTHLMKIVTDALDDLMNDKVDPEQLQIWVKLGKNPEDYAKNTQQKKIGLLNNGKAGELAYYYKGIDGPTHDPKLINKNAYKELLLAAGVEDSLEVLGQNVKVFKTKWVAPEPGQVSFDQFITSVWGETKPTDEMKPELCPNCGSEMLVKLNKTQTDVYTKCKKCPTYGFIDVKP